MPNDKTLEIAVARLGAIGDVLLTTPLLEAIRRAYPGSRITYIVGQQAAAVFDPSPLISDMIVWPGVRSRVDDIRTIRTIARRRFDITISLSQAAKVNFALWLTGARRRLGFTPVPGAWMLTDPIDAGTLPQDLHRTLYFLTMAKRLGIALPDPVRLHYQVTPAESDHAASVLAQWQLDPERETLIAIHPGSSPLLRNKRRWPVEKFVEVARVLSARPGVRVLIFGGVEERELSAHFQAIGSRSIVDLTARLNFREFAAVLQRCHVLIHNDSAPLHLAGALGVPIVSIFGYQRTSVWGPIGPRDRTIRRDIPCSPCAAEFVCDRSFECLSRLDSPEVIAAVDGILNPIGKP